MRFIALLAAMLVSFSATASVDVHTSTSRTCAIPTISAAAAYAEGDAVGGQMDFEALGFDRPSGRVQSVTIYDNSETLDILTLYCFDQDFTEATNNSALSYSIADVSHAILKVSIGVADWVELGGGNLAQITDIGKAIKSTDTFLRCQLETSSNPTYNDVNELTVCIDVHKDSP